LALNRCEDAKHSYQTAWDLATQNATAQPELAAFKSDAGVALARFYRDSGANEDALWLLQQVVTAARNAGDTPQQIWALAEIGRAQRELGDLTQAQQTYQETLALLRNQLPNAVDTEAELLTDLAKVLRSNNDAATAVLRLEEAALLVSGNDYPQQRTATLVELARAYGDQKQYSDALQSYNEALMLVRSASGWRDRAAQETEILLGMGAIYAAQLQFADGIQSYEAAQALASSSGNLLLQGEAYDQLGRLYRDSQQYGPALNSFQKALPIAQRLIQSNVGCALPVAGSWSATIYKNMGKVYQALNQLDKALTAYETARTLAKQQDNTALDQEMAAAVSNVYRLQGRHDEALALAQELGDFELEDKILNEMGRLMRDAGQLDLALEPYEQALERAREV
ncbi:MAG: tetratricopeptide repeat protein, partial [Caldilineaceae bacterium]|nr:tetratricopeptide repeat protein [Caldilineaceae bacterium]